MEMNSYASRVEVRICFGIFISAFINIHKPFYGALFLLFFQISLIHIIYSTLKLKPQRKQTLFHSGQLLAPSVFTLFCTLSTLILLIGDISSTQKAYGVIRYFGVITNILFSLSLALYFTINKPSEKLFAPLPISIIMATILIFIDYQFNQNSVMSNDSVRVIVANNIRQLGYIAMLGSLYCAIKIIQQKVLSNTYIVFSAMFVINFSLLIWLGGRGAIISFVISLCLSILIANKNFYERCAHLAAISTMVIISYFISIPFSVFSWNGANRFMILSQQYETSINQISNGRMALWNESVNLISQKPFLGYGPEAHIFETKIGFLQPHNFLLQSLLEFGILGTVPILFILYYIIKSAIANALSNSTTNNLYACGAIIAIITNSFYSGTLYHAPPLLIMCIASSYVLSVTLKRNIPLTNHQIANVAKNET
ncbi:O-antigen ligase family protein [Vibrio sp. DNB22_12_1]